MFGALGKLFGQGAKNVAKNYGDDVLNRVVTNYGDDIAHGLGNKSASVLDNLVPMLDNAPIQPRSKVGDALVGASNVGLNAPLSLTRKGMREVGDTAKEKVGMLFDRTGISSTDKLRELATELTGGKNSFMDEVTNSVRTNLGGGNFVDLTDLQPQLRDVRESMDKLIRPKFDAQDPVALANNLRSAASDIRRSATPKAGDKMKANLLDELGIEINKRIDMNVDPKHVANAFDDTANEFLHRSQEALRANDKEKYNAYKNLAKEISEIPLNERTIDRYRSFKRDFVDISKMGKLSDQATGGGSVSKTLKSLPIVGDMADALLATPVEKAAQKSGEVMRKVGKDFQSGKAQQTLKTVGKVGAGVGALALLSGRNSGGLPPVGADGGTGALASAGGGVGAGVSATPGSGTVQFEDGSVGQPYKDELTVGGYNRDALEQGYVAALMANDGNSAKAIGTMIDLLDNKESRAEKLAESKTSKSDAKTKNAVGKIQQLESLYSKSGGAQGPMGALNGLLNQVTFGAANPAQAAYDAQRQAAAVALARASGDSGALSNQDIQGYMSMLPTPTDNPQAAQLKLQSIYAQLGM